MRRKLKQLYRLMLILPVIVLPAFAQTVIVSGVVKDARTHEAVDGAAVSVIETRLCGSTDTAGVFHFALPRSARYTISIRRIGYAPIERAIAVGEAGQKQPALFELNPAAVQVDEMIIRSTRAQSTLTTSPIPFSVLTSDEITRHPLLTSADAMKTIPGITLVRDGEWQTAVSIRGMSRSNIVMLVDNTRIETANDVAGAFSLVDVNELERVEAVKSPGSSIWGSGAFGGVVHMMTKHASFSEQSESHMQLSEQAASVDGLVSHHLGFDHSSPNIGVRIGLGYRKAGNTQTPDGVIPNSQFRDFNISGSAGVKTFGAQTLLLSYQRSQADDAGIPGGASFAQTATVRYTLARRELAAAEYSLPHLSGVVDLMTVRVSHQVISRNVEVLQSPTLTLTPHAVHGTNSALIESRLLPSDAVTITAGIDIWQRSLESRRERVNKTLATITEERPVPSSTYLSGGSYVHGIWTVAPERVTIDAGARYDRIRVTNEMTLNPEYVITPTGVMNTMPAGQTMLWNAQKVDNGSWSADAGVTMALMPGVDISCVGAAGFRSPSLEERFQFLDLGSLVHVGDPALKPEQSRSVNLGLSLRTPQASSRADVFVNSFTDLVTEIPGVFEGRSALIKANIGEALMYGGELAGNCLITEWASAQYSFAYVHGEDTRVHAPLPQIPPLTGTVSVSAFIRSASTATIGVDFAVRQNRIAASETATPGYAVYNIDLSDATLFAPLLSKTGAVCTLKAGVENVFNTSYRIHLRTLRGVIQQEPGRNFYASVSFGF